MRMCDWSSDVCSSDLQRCVGHRNAEFQADEVARLVHGRVAAAAVGGESVLFEAAPGVVARRLEHHIDAPAQIARHGAAIALQAGDHLDLPLALRSEEHTSELQSLIRISYAVICLKKTI